MTLERQGAGKSVGEKDKMPDFLYPPRFSFTTVGIMLLTGFEPYGGHAINPSAEIVRALDGAMIAGTRVTGRILPVVYDGMAKRVQALIEETSPPTVICLGLDPGEWAIRLERVAANALDFEIADNAGAILCGPLAEGGPDKLRSTLPLEEIEARLHAGNIRVRSSDDAGRYLCNAVMYLALSAAARRSPPPPCGFIHLPFLPEQAGDKASLPLETMIEAVRIAIAAALEST